jgi:hypothetical protein
MAPPLPPHSFPVKLVALPVIEIALLALEYSAPPSELAELFDIVTVPEMATKESLSM